MYEKHFENDFWNIKIKMEFMTTYNVMIVHIFTNL
jgi:hypothetical protein